MAFLGLLRGLSSISTVSSLCSNLCSGQRNSTTNSDTAVSSVAQSTLESSSSSSLSTTSSISSTESQTNENAVPFLEKQLDLAKEEIQKLKNELAIEKEVIKKLQDEFNKSQQDLEERIYPLAKELLLKVRHSIAKNSHTNLDCERPALDYP